MAALVAIQQRAYVAGHSSITLPMQALNSSMQAARAHLTKLEAAVNTLEAANNVDVSIIRGARAMLDQARTALGTIESDAVHCLVTQAIADHRLPPEASVLGRVAALRELHRPSSNPIRAAPIRRCSKAWPSWLRARLGTYAR
jgi:hypothetical protein